MATHVKPAARMAGFMVRSARPSTQDPSSLKLTVGVRPDFDAQSLLAVRGAASRVCDASGSSASAAPTEPGHLEMSRGWWASPFLPPVCAPSRRCSVHFRVGACCCVADTCRAGQLPRCETSSAVPADALLSCGPTCLLLSAALAPWRVCTPCAGRQGGTACAPCARLASFCLLTRARRSLRIQRGL